MPALGLAREDVGQVHFHERDAHRQERIADGERGVGEGGGVDQRAVRPGGEPLHQLHEASLVVGLLPIQLRAQLPRALADGALDVAQRRPSVDLGFAGAQQIEIGSVEDEDRDRVDEVRGRDEIAARLQVASHRLRGLVRAHAPDELARLAAALLPHGGARGLLLLLPGDRECVPARGQYFLADLLDELPDCHT